MVKKLKQISFILAFVLAASVFFTTAVSAQEYKIKAGDTVWKIANQHGISTTSLMKANKMKSATLRVGQKIQVPDSTTHFVDFGDTIWKIAQKHNVSSSDIIKQNGIKNTNGLQVGQKIKIPQKQNSNSNSNGSGSAKVNALIAAGKKYLGRPYQFGASSSQTRTFDCSSFTQRAYRDIGINIKRSSRSQYKYPPGRLIKKSELRRGDLVFFDYTRDGTIDHVAIYYGDNKLLHTYRPKGVEVGPFNNYWHTRYVGAKRIIQ